MGTIFVFETDYEEEENKQDRKDFVRGRRKSAECEKPRVSFKVVNLSKSCKYQGS